MRKIVLGLAVLASCSPTPPQAHVARNATASTPQGHTDTEMAPEMPPSPEIALGATTLPEGPPTTLEADPPKQRPSRPVQREPAAPVTTILAETPRNTSGMPPKYVSDCESGGDPTAVNPNGHYGKWQFSQSTWNSVGGSGRPDQASEAEQDYRASILWNGGKGASHWSCY